MNINFQLNEEKTKLLKLSEAVNYKVSLILEFLSDDFIPLSKLFKKYNKAGNSKPELSSDNDEDCNFYKDIIARIITNLQYHDIFSQRLEHVIQTNFSLIAELLMIEKEEAKETIILLPYLNKVASLCKEQILSIAEEYNEVRAKLTHDLSLMEVYITKVSAISLDLSDYFNKPSHFDSLIEQIRTNLYQIENFNFSFTTDTKGDFTDCLKKIESTYTMQVERQVMQKLFPDFISEEVSQEDDDILF